jgi:tRNA A37 N6-isopentenylltransferase MiaA
VFEDFFQFNESKEEKGEDCLLTKEEGIKEFEKLKDSKIFEKIHRNDKRKIENYLEIIEKKSIDPNSKIKNKGVLRYDCYFIWLSCGDDRQTLYDKLDTRVEKMIKVIHSVN